ncbi:MAG: hypothetical protein ACJ0O9_05445 [Flavobacteriaceae bacterium]
MRINPTVNKLDLDGPHIGSFEYAFINDEHQNQTSFLIFGEMALWMAH